MEAAMPFKSEAQRKYLYAKHPELAKKWQQHTPKGADLPEHVTSSDNEKKASFLLKLLEKRSESTPPPGLRPAGSIGEGSCQSCTNFDGQGNCSKFNSPVQPTDVCDAFEAMKVGTNEVVSPEKPVGIDSQSSSSLGLPGGEEIDLPDSPMDAEKNFKFAFLLKCAEEGLSSKETLLRIKMARKALRVKQAGFWSTLLGLSKPVSDIAFTAGIAAPIVGGGVTGYGLRQILGPSKSPFEDRLRIQRKKDLSEEYERLAAETEYKQKLRDAAGKSGLIRLG